MSIDAIIPCVCLRIVCTENKKATHNIMQVADYQGGEYRSRTDDLLHAMQAL
jgi:hypothetical protein